MIADQKNIRIRRRDYDTMLHQVQASLPLEACGILAGLEGISIKVYPMTNTLHSPVRFFMDPQEQLSVFLDIERRDWELLAIYHSHPNGPPHPSETDTREYFYPEITCLIWSKAEGDWICRAFYISNQQVSPGNVEIIE